MSEYTAVIRWQRGNQDFLDNAYSRGHQWLFDGGLSIPASASPQVVPLPMSIAENVDPEEAFIASLSSCHMLFFLSLAAQDGIVVDAYTDEASGTMKRNGEGKTAMTKVVLRPHATYAGHPQPDRQKVTALHHRAHDMCFIANSVRTEVVTEVVA